MRKSANGRVARTERRGGAIVEVAVCFPVFMLILLGIVEFGRAMSVSQMLNSAAREGCRSAIIDGSTTEGITAEIKEHVVSMIGCSGDSVTVSIAVTSRNTGAAVAELSAAESRDLIEIDVSVPYSAVSFAVNNFLQGQSLRGECSMRHE
ncbi:MAG: pilus assembly protein [Planctomycetaceae bacterium]|nr:pilus assembly protein [Planctomycetaceae bacterium]